MAILFSCQCGRQLRTNEARAGTKARCPSCGAILAVPTLSLAAPPPLADVKRSTTRNEGDTDLSQPPSIRTPALFLYLGVLSASAVFWAAGATWRLRVRAHQLDEALQHVASAREETQAALKERAADEERAERRLKSVEARAGEQLKSVMTEMAEIKAREAKRLESLNADLSLPKIHDGNNIVKQNYIESFTISDREVRFVFTNKTAENLKPNFDFLLVNKDGHVTASVGVHWTDNSIKPGETRVSFETVPTLESGAPVAYSLRFLK
jgi:hypothetical protein